MIDRLESLDRCLDTQLLLERYRCPDNPVTFVLSGDTRAAEGYFEFGDGVICFGRTSKGTTQSSAEGSLYDATSDVIVEDSKIALPFNPAEVITNLRMERYRMDTGMKSWPGGDLIRNSYYMVRPMMPVRVRRHFQKLYFRGWRQIPFPYWPVDVTVENIQQKLLLFALRARRGNPIPFIWFWPEGIPSCTILTHDIETQSGVDFCSALMDLNDSFGIKSSFQVVPEERYSVREAFLDEIRARGFEVNVHDLNHDGHLFRDKEEFLRRAARINDYGRRFGAMGFRSAVLYRKMDWLHALEFAYDMSIPNVSHLDPQRGGCCTVMPFFVGNMVELPVTMTQDYTLFHILERYSTDIWLEQSRRIRQMNGILSAIIHPDYLNSQRAAEVYKGLLSHLSELRSAGETWIARPGEVAFWWRQRSLLRLVSAGSGWRIEGEGSDRARLAYAVLDGESLRYEFGKSAA